MALLLGDNWPGKVCEHWDYLDRRERGGNNGNQGSWRLKTIKVTFSQSVRRANETISHKSVWDQVTQENLREETHRTIVTSSTGLMETNK